MRYAGAACAVLLGAAACSFQPSGGEVDAGGDLRDADETVDGAEPDGASAVDAAQVDAAQVDAAQVDAPGADASVPDAAPDAPVVADVAHVADDSIGTGDLAVTAPITVQTSGGSFGFGTPLPSGVTFTAEPQDPSGPELAVLRVRNLSITADVRVVGTRPLVILAESISLAAVIDAGARQDLPGPGGSTTGAGVGAAGAHLGSYGDSGGGGGSYGGAGGAGGNAVCASGCFPDQTVQGGGAGATYGNDALETLRGGSGGGRSYFPAAQTQCTPGAPGAGGGAIQLAARTSITIASGGIHVGGGGGGGGDQCNNPYNWLAGHGGGSGGAIYLQAPTVTNAGILAANGGAGGGGAGTNGDGMTGADGALGTNVAAGAPANGSYSAGGGDGAAGSGAGEAGSSAGGDGNGGGGGGGTGRIHVRYRTSYTAGTQSPTAVTSTY